MIQTIVQSLRQKFERKPEKTVGGMRETVSLPNTSGYVQQTRIMFETNAVTSTSSSKFYTIRPTHYHKNNAKCIEITHEPIKSLPSKPVKSAKSSIKTKFYLPSKKNQLEIYTDDKSESVSTKSYKEPMKSDASQSSFRNSEMTERTFPNLSESSNDHTAPKKIAAIPLHKDSGNLNRTPSEVVDPEGLCIYTSDDSQSNYGSFKKRPKYAKNNGTSTKNHEIEIVIDDDDDDDDVFKSLGNDSSKKISKRYDDNKIRLRLKKEESDYKSIKRYESILSNAPLYQHTVVNRCVNSHLQETPSTEYTDRLDKICRSGNVAQLINSFNQLDNDMDKNLLNSICPMKMRSFALRDTLTDDSTLSDKTLVVDSDSTLNQEDIAFNRGIMEMLNSTSGLRWSNMSQVKESGILNKLNKKEVEYYESKFELISSEASYNRSLQVLIDVFYNELSITTNNNIHDNTSTLGNSSSNIIQIQEKFLLKPHQKDHLFSNILKIYKVSSQFLKKLEKIFASDIQMKNISTVVTELAKRDFDVYVPYLQNQKFQTETYNELKKNSEACKRIEELEAHPQCSCLSLDSFLLLPMQRLFRIKLLLETLLRRLPSYDDLGKLQTQKAIEATDKILSLCTVKKNEMDERQRMLELCNLLKFPTDQATPPFASGQIVLEGSLKRYRKETGAKNWLTSFRIASASDFQFLLTNHYLIMFKVHKNGDHFVDDFCKLTELSIDPISGSTSPIMKNSTPSGGDISPPSSPTISRIPNSSCKAKLTINKTGSDSYYSYIIQASNSETIQKWIHHIQSNQVID